MELVNSIAPDTGVLLNPETSVTVWFPPATVRAMAEGRPPDPGRFVEIAAGEEAYLGQPAKYPSRLVEALVGLFQRLGVVEQGYLAQVYVPSDKSPPHVVIGIKLVPNSPMEFKTLVPEMGQLASGVLGQGEVVDFMEIGDDRISKYMSGEAKPF